MEKIGQFLGIFLVGCCFLGIAYYTFRLIQTMFKKHPKSKVKMKDYLDEVEDHQGGEL